MKKTLWIIKFFVSGVIAAIVLSLFSLFYYNPPIIEPQPDKITNGKFIPDKFWSCMTEGFGYGTTDSYGYNNAYYGNCDNPDVVFMGSSHLEALQVPENANFVYLLNEKLENDDKNNNDYKCINIGVSGHFFNVSVSNFKYVSEKYANMKLLVIETGNIEFNEDSIDKMLAGDYHSDLSEKSLLHRVAQKIPYIRLLSKKVSEVKDNGMDTQNAVDFSNTNLEVYSEKMNEVLKNISDISKDNGFKVMVLFHSKINVGADKNATYACNQDYIESFKEICIKNNIEFVDVTPGFIEEFSKSYKMPYGYENTVPGEGHLNTTGHKIISEELYLKIDEMLEEK